MIIQTGMRTDIPAFYSEWLCNRIKEGFVLVRNPYNPSQVTRYSLSPEVVDLISFCTKNPAPMLPKMDVLDPYGQYWFVTITPYGKESFMRMPKFHGHHEIELFGLLRGSASDKIVPRLEEQIGRAHV